MLKVGTIAPDFTTKLDDGRAFKLSSLRGKNVVLYFYPADDTPVCTMQACMYRDNYEELRGLNAEIYGVSGNDEERHAKFRTKHKLPFPLIADLDGSVRKAYDIYGFFGLRANRCTYIIDAKGVIQSAFKHELSVSGHKRDTFEALRKLQTGT